MLILAQFNRAMAAAASVARPSTFTRFCHNMEQDKLVREKRNSKSVRSCFEQIDSAGIEHDQGQNVHLKAHKFPWKTLYNLNLTLADFSLDYPK